MLKYEKDKEKAAFKEMSFQKKMEHIREYYTLPIVLGLVGLYIFGWALNHYVINPPKKATVNITFHSYEISQDEMEKLEKELPDVFPEYYDDRHEISTDQISTGIDMGAAGYDSASGTKLVAMIETKSIDLLVGDLSALGNDAFNAFLMPLTDVFTDEELARIKELGYVQEGADSPIVEVSEGELNEYGYETLKDPQPYLVDLSGNLTLRTIINGEATYVGFAANAPHLEEAKELFWYFLTGERASVG